MINKALAAASVAVLCPYDIGCLAPQVAEMAGRTHPFIRRASEPPGPAAPSAEFATDYLPEGAVLPLPEPPAGARRLAYTADLRAVRAVVTREATLAGLDADRVTDLVLAVGEVAANTVRHTAGGGMLQIWRAPADPPAGGADRGKPEMPAVADEEIICQVSDSGWITDPLVGRRRPAGTGGLGLWVVHQVCDLVQLRSGPGGTTVRMHLALPRGRARPARLTPLDSGRANRAR